MNLSAQSRSYFCRRQNLLFWGLAFLASVHFALTYTNQDALQWPYDYYDYSVGKVEYPYRSRVLMAWVFRAGIHLLHAHFQHDQRYVRGPVFFAQSAAIIVSLLVTLWAVRRSIENFLGAETPFRWLSFLVFYMAFYNCLLIGELRVASPYDLPSLAFFAVALLAILKRNRLLYYPVFLIGTFNRETTLFLPAFFLLAQLRSDLPLLRALGRIRFAVLLETVAQCMAWELIRMLCDHLVGKGALRPHEELRLNLHYLTTAPHWITLLSVFGFAWVPFWIYFRQIPSVYLRRCSLLIVPWLAIMVMVGDLLELRIHLEWVPYFVLCLTLVLSRYVRFAPEPARLDAAESAAPLL